MVLVTAAAEKNGSGLRWGSGHGYGRAADSGHEGGGNDSRLETQGYLGGGNVKW